MIENLSDGEDILLFAAGGRSAGPGHCPPSPMVMGYPRRVCVPLSALALVFSAMTRSEDLQHLLPQDG